MVVLCTVKGVLTWIVGVSVGIVGFESKMYGVDGVKKGGRSWGWELNL